MRGITPSVTRRKPVDAERKTLADALSALSWQQRLAIDALLRSATRPAAFNMLRDAGMVVERREFDRWLKNPKFVAAWRLRELAITKNITKESIQLKTESILEEAMAGTPIIGRVGPDQEDIIGYRKDLPSALRAIELQGKTVGAFGNDGAIQVGVLIDIDFSGRKDLPVVAAEVVEGEIVEPVTSQPRPTGSGLVDSEEDLSWLE